MKPKVLMELCGPLGSVEIYTPRLESHRGRGTGRCRKVYPICWHARVARADAGMCAEAAWGTAAQIIHGLKTALSGAR